MPSSVGTGALGGYRKYFWLIAAAVATLDQLTKSAAGKLGGAIEIVPLFLRLTPARLNPSGLFSLGPRGPLLYIILTIAGLGLITFFFLTSPAGRLCPHIALGSVCGGAIGNLIDRIACSGVRDFIDLHWMDRAHWPTFNLADAAICVGVGLLLLDAFRSPGDAQQQGSEGASDAQG